MKKSTSGRGTSASAKKSTASRSAGPAKKSASRSTTATAKKPAGRSAAPASRAASGSRSAAPKKSTAARSTRSAATANRSKAKAKAPSSPKDDLQKVFQDCLKDVYYAEKQLYKALNKMAKAAMNSDLKTAFETHRQETEGQIEKLDEVFGILGMRAQGKKCPAMDGLVEEGSEAIEEYDKGPARDAALIASAQKAEHYEMSAYGSLRAFANVLGYSDCAQIFDEILNQESATDEKLTMIAQSVNEEATAGGESDEDEDMED